MRLKRILINALDYKNLTLISFTLLVYVAFFGAALPFNYEAGPKDGTASNPINQILYISMFILGFAVFIIKYDSILPFIQNEKYLSLFIFFCFISTFWSNFPFVSFRRFFQLFVAYFIITQAVLFLNNKIIANRIRIILFLYIALTLFAILFIPDAIDPLFNSPRGLTLQKNQFGQISNLLLLMFLFLRNSGTGKKFFAFDVIGIIISIFFIILSLSTTAFVSMIYIFSLQSIFFTDRIFKDIRIGRFISLTIIIFIFSLAVFLSLNSDIVERIVTQLLGKDLSFTGRTEIWQMMLNEIAKHPILGVGYSSFWDVPKAEGYALIGNTAHNGYLEILNELGIIGFSLMIIVLINFFYRAIKISTTINLITIISILILNFSESSLFREKGAITFVTLFIILINSKDYFIRKISNE